jgi:hypothetical protein
MSTNIISETKRGKGARERRPTAFSDEHLGTHLACALDDAYVSTNIISGNIRGKGDREGRPYSIFQRKAAFSVVARATSTRQRKYTRGEEGTLSPFRTAGGKFTVS